MKNNIIISPSVLSMDYANMQEQMNQINASKAQWLHFDVMDGHFVPNLTFGPDLLKGFRKMTDLILDVHLMVTDPTYFAPIFIEAGADIITFHVETFDNDCEKISQCLQMIHDKKAQAGIVIKPSTDITQFESILDQIDLVLIMSVEPGFGGQAFMEDQLEKVRWLDAQRGNNNYNFRIEIDGGINDQTAKLAKEAGCDTLVAGSYIFKDDIEKRVESLL